MLDALLATIGTLGVLASLLAKRGSAGTGTGTGADAAADADTDTDTDTASCEPAHEDDSQDAVPALHGKRRGCPYRRVRAGVVKGTGR